MDETERSGAERLLSRWYIGVSRSQRAHFLVANHLTQLNRWLGVPVVILSSIVGTTVFATLEKEVAVGIKVAVGLTSVTAAVLSALQTFLGFAERAEKHRDSGSRYGTIRRKIEAFQALHPEGPDES